MPNQKQKTKTVARSRAKSTKKTVSAPVPARLSFLQRKYMPLLFVAVFAIIGGTITLLMTHAATSSVAITSGVNATKCLDNYQSKKANGNKIDLYSCNGTSAQQWTVNTNGTITNANGYCLDVKNAGVASGTIVWLYVCNGTVAQQWTVNSSAKTIINPHSGLCLDDQNARTTNGNQIWAYTCNGTPAQQWTIPVPATPKPTPTPTPTPTPSPTPVPAPTPAPPSAPTPLGVSGSWALSFDDEFTKDKTIDQSVWAQTSAAESQCGQGNKGNGQAEWNQGYTNDTVDSTNGLVLTDLRKTVKQCNDTFTWTGGLLSSKQSFATGSVIEEKFQFPSNVPAGGWPSFWTWCATGDNGCEVDVYEAWPPNSNGNGTIDATDHVGGGTTGRINAYVSVGAWHTMDAVINAHSVTWHLDGKSIGTAQHSTAQNAFNLILDNDVCDGSGCPAPAASTTKITENVAYVRVWKPGN